MNTEAQRDADIAAAARLAECYRIQAALKPLTSQDVERLKSKGRYFHAGALSAALGHASSYYGCHYGMRSTRTMSAAEFDAGFQAALAALLGGTDR
jgi:hypothetical protein